MSVETLHADEKTENTLDNPDLVKPEKREISIDSTSTPVVEVPARTFAVYRIR